MSVFGESGNAMTIDSS